MSASLVGPAPEGMPDPAMAPPQLARSGDPFAALRVVHFVSRLRRNESLQLRDVVAALNAEFLDWYFSEKVVLAELVQLQANWSISFHGDDRIVLDRNDRGHTLLIVDSTKMSSFLVNEALRLAEACRRSSAGSPWATGCRPTTGARPGVAMKLLLTSGGVTNASIHAALEQLLGKPVAECQRSSSRRAVGPPDVWTGVRAGTGGAEPDFRHFSGLGWASLGVLELTALPTIGAERWVPWVREADVLLVDGGDATYLCHWMRESGLADLLPSLPDTVWVGVSAGSMVMTPRIGAYFVEWPSARDDRGLGVVDFAILPHLDAFPRQRNGGRGAVGRRASARRRTPSTSRRQSRSSTGPLRWSPKADGRSSGLSD